MITIGVRIIFYFILNTRLSVLHKDFFITILALLLISTGTTTELSGVWHVRVSEIPQY